MAAIIFAARDQWRIDLPISRSVRKRAQRKRVAPAFWIRTNLSWAAISASFAICNRADATRFCCSSMRFQQSSACFSAPRRMRTIAPRATLLAPSARSLPRLADSAAMRSVRKAAASSPASRFPRFQAKLLKRSRATWAASHRRRQTCSRLEMRRRCRKRAADRKWWAAESMQAAASSPLCRPTMAASAAARSAAAWDNFAST